MRGELLHIVSIGIVVCLFRFEVLVEIISNMIIFDKISKMSKDEMDVFNNYCKESKSY